MTRPGAPRVVMVVRLFHPWVGGTERQAATLARSLIARGVDVRIVTGRWFRRTARCETIDSIPVYRNHTMWEFFGVRGLRKLGGYLYMVTLGWHLWRTRRDYDVIHIHGMNYHSAVAVRLGRWLGRPTVTKLANSGRASDVDKMRSDRQLWGARFLLPTALRSDRFIALNTAVADELRSAGVSRERVVSIPNGVALDGIVAKSDYALAGRARVVFVGRLHEQKGLTTLVDALAELHRHRPDSVEVTFVGEGPYRTDLEAHVRRLGLAEVVHMPGERADVSSALRRADVFVLPSRAEGLSNALLEAMAHGLPVVVSDIPGNADVVEHDRDGLRFGYGDHHGLAECLAALFADDARRARLGSQARATIEARYALPEVVDRYLDLYEELVVSGAHRG